MSNFDHLMSLTPLSLFRFPLCNLLSPLFHNIENPEQLYQHFEVLRGSSDPQALLPPLPAGLHPEVAEVLVACLRVDPTQRPTAQQLLHMDFFNSKL